MEQIEIQTQYSKIMEVHEETKETKEDKELDLMLERVTKQLKKKELPSAKFDEEVSKKLRSIPFETSPLLNGLERLIDHEDISNMIGFKQMFDFCECQELSLLPEQSRFLLSVKLMNYKPLEVFCFNLKRAIQMPWLDISPEIKLEIEDFVADFSIIYEKKTKLYAHLATDPSVLQACLGHIDFSNFRNFKVHTPIPIPVHTCKLNEAEFLRRIKGLNLSYGGYDSNLNLALEKTPNFSMGIWEEYFANPQNTDYLADFLAHFIMFFNKANSKIWELQCDLNFVKEIYNQLKSVFKEDLKKEFPSSKCKEVLVKMQNYDSKPHSLYNIAIIGKYTSKTEKIINWFLNLTQSHINKNSISLSFERANELIEMRIYLLSSNNFRVCHFDFIIYPDKIFCPCMNTHLKHFALVYNYCENSHTSTFKSVVSFKNVSENKKYIWDLLDQAIQGAFADNFRYVN